MAEKKTSGRRVSVFYIIYFALVILAAALIIAGCAYVRGLLAEYEAAQPKYVAEAVFRKYFSPIDYDRLLSDARYDAGLADREAVREYLAGQIGSEELTWSTGSSNDPDTVRCIVKAGSKLVGSIYLTASDTVTKHGFTTYRLDGVELSLNPASIPGGQLTFTAPAGYTVTLDGTALTEDLITSTFTDPGALPYYPAGVTGVDFAVYTVPGLQAPPGEVSVADPEGNPAPVSFDEENNAYTAGIAYSAALAEEYGPFVTQAVEGYAAYMQKVPGSSFRSIRGYFDPDSALYSAVSAAGADLWMVKEPDRNEFQDVEIGEFYAFPGGIFSCHISLTQVLTRGGVTRPDAIDMVVFLRQTDSGYRIYEWHTAV